MTPEFVIVALREYEALYGELTQACFSPGSAKRNGRPDLVERYYRPRADGSRWPSLNAIKSKFPSWNAARAAAGFAANSTGPASGRRKAGEAEPILTVRERLVYVPHAKTIEATRRMHAAQDHARALAARLERAQAEIARLRAERRAPVPRVETVVRDRVVHVEPKVITKTKTVKVRDERALERLRGRLADELAARRAVEDQLRSELRARNREKSRLADLELETLSAVESARLAEGERDRAVDRLTAVEGVVARLRGEIAEARDQLLGVREAAVTAELVRQADRRAQDAEVRAARAEREMAEQGAAVTGEMRRLTADELEALRHVGPAGPAVLAAALKQLAKARSRGHALDEALMAIARAAVTWHDRLR